MTSLLIKSKVIRYLVFKGTLNYRGFYTLNLKKIHKEKKSAVKLLQDYTLNIIKEKKFLVGHMNKWKCKVNIESLFLFILRMNKQEKEFVLEENLFRLNY